MKILVIVRRYPLLSYFILAYGIAWGGCLVTAGPKFLRGEPLAFADGAVMFLAMLAGPSLAGVGMTWITDGGKGLRQLLLKMSRWRVNLHWFSMAALLPPSLFITVLLVMSALVSPVFAPRFIPQGIAIGLLAGFFEEIGWTGFAFPRLRERFGLLAGAVLLGLLHSFWHIAADYLFSSAEYGAYWLPHFLIWMVASMTAMRVLIVWVYSNTRSVFLAQLMHASSTAVLAVIGPALSPVNDTLLYAVYAGVLWLVVGVVVMGRDSRKA